MSISNATPSFPPHLIPRVQNPENMFSYSLSPEEGYLLSRIDGIMPVAGLCESSGLGREQTLSLLQSLVEKEVIFLFDPEARAGKERAEETEQAGLAEGTAALVYSHYDLPALKSILAQPLPKGDGLIPLIEAIFLHLEHLSYYDLLGVHRQADVAEIRKAYLRRTKSFHPDRFYRKADKEFRQKVQEIFKQLNKGHQLLLDPEKRKEYDQTLQLEEETRPPEEEITMVPLTARTRTVKGESPWKRIRVAKQKPIEEKVRPPRPAEAAPKQVGPKLKLGLKDGQGPMDPLMKRILEVKKKKEEEKKLRPEAQQAERFYQGSLFEMERGNFASARINLQLALQYDPDNPRYQQAWKELEEREEKTAAEIAFKAGLEAQKIGDFKAAARHYREALRRGLKMGKLYYHLAVVVMELENNWELSRSLLLEAVKLEPKSADYYVALARAYKGLGQRAAAVVQMEKALELDPKNKFIMRELKELRKS